MALAAQPKNLQIENVVLNLPRNIRCNKCRNTMAKDTKINSRKEKSSGNLEYLGIKNIRFHFNCTQCSAGIVLRTNPQLSRVLCESDATLFCGDQLPGRLPYGLEEMKRERGRRLSQLFWSFSSRKMNSRAEISKVARDCSVQNDGSRDDGGRDDNCINGGGGESGGNESMAMSSGGSGEAVVVIVMTR
ncbi:uncharacterized protein LOC18785752 [Prunus persica]|uniref:uncharacterized protein LOC18785752 n=1 Tax=Prunus persica TaxID=3760 RepID=UPI0009AB49FF|nr:uncharacterized protein LOC18785752 [Prunus persica]